MIYFNCGCGFRTDLEGRAMLHVAETGHTVMVLGRITPKEVGAEIQSAAAPEEPNDQPKGQAVRRRPS